MIKIPEYRKVYEDLKNSILSGKYPDGALLPSEHELCDIWQLNRATVRQALNELVKDGYIVKHQGKGSIVRRDRRSLGVLSIKGFSEVASTDQQGSLSKFIQLPIATDWPNDFEFNPAPEEKEAGCYYFKRIRYVGADPVMIEDTWVPNLMIPNFEAQPFVNGSFFETLNTRYQIGIDNAEQDIRAVAASTEIARLLQIKGGTPLLKIHIRFITDKGFNLYSTLICNTQHYTIGNKV